MKNKMKCPECGKMVSILCREGHVAVSAKPGVDLTGWLCNGCYEKQDQQGKVSTENQNG